MEYPPKFTAHYQSPVGHLRIVASDLGLSSLLFLEDEETTAPPVHNAVTEQCLLEIGEYFEGVRQQFSVPLAPHGTPFEESVWMSLLAVPFGETCSYMDIARRLQNPKAIRAVGRANGANPIAILIPCHRVVGSDGSLTGYAGGMHRKRWLLDHEARIAGTQLF